MTDNSELDGLGPAGDSLEPKASMVPADAAGRPPVEVVSDSPQQQGVARPGQGSAVPADGSAERPAAAMDASAIAREAAAQTLAGIGLADSGAVQRLLETERQLAAIARLPEDLKSRMENIFATLLDKLEDPKGLLIYNRQRRLFLDLLSLHDLIVELEAGARVEGEDSPHLANYRNIREQLLQLLAMNGVTPIVSEVGALFSPQQHRVVRVIRTEEPVQDGCIDSVVRDGFMFASFVVRPTEVVVRKRATG